MLSPDARAGKERIFSTAVRPKIGKKVTLDENSNSGPPITNIIAAIATNIVNNAITVVTITIITITRLANIIDITDTVDFTNSVTSVKWVNNIIAVNATKIFNNAITVVTITIITITSLANNTVVIANVFASFFFLFSPRTSSLPSLLLVSLWLGPSSSQLLSPPPLDYCTVFPFFFLSPTVSPLSGG